MQKLCQRYFIWNVIYGGFYPKTKTELLVAIIFYLQELYLGNNKITNLNRESFASMTSLSIFGIRDNKINR